MEKESSQKQNKKLCFKLINDLDHVNGHVSVLEKIYKK